MAAQFYETLKTGELIIPFKPVNFVVCELHLFFFFKEQSTHLCGNVDARQMQCAEFKEQTQRLQVG